MAKKTTKKIATIEFNGKRYDAMSGVLIADVSAPLTVPAVIAPENVAMTDHSPATTPVHPKTSSAPKLMDVQRPQAQHVKPHKAQHSQTLVRTAVKKPNKSFKQQVRVQPHTSVLASMTVQAISPKHSVQQINQKRLQHANKIAKSEHVQRFATTTPSATMSPTSGHNLDQIHHQPVHIQAPQPASHAVIKAASPSLDIFEQAIAKATSHEQPPYNPKKHAKHLRKQAKHAKRADQPFHRRTMSLATVSLAVLLLTGFIAWQNKASLTLRYANAKAGFSAALPAYKPSGFAYGHFSYGPGSVAINFTNSLSGHSFAIKQQSSNWDSQTLLNNVVASNNHSYQTLQVAGRTIYVYGNNNASWVDKGILYQINSDGSLSTNDVLNIAGSI